MRYILCLIFSLHGFYAVAQTKVAYPKPLVIDLSNPKLDLPKSLDKEARKKWKENKKLQKLKLKQTTQLYKAKIDSLKYGWPDGFEAYGSTYTDQIANGLEYKEELKKTIDSLKSNSLNYQEAKLKELQHLYNIDSSNRYMSEFEQHKYLLNDSLRNEKAKGILDQNIEDQIQTANLTNYSEGDLVIPDVAPNPIDSSSYQQYITESNNLKDSIDNINYAGIAAGIMEQKVQEQLSAMVPQELLTEGVNGLSEEEWQSSFQQLMGSNEYQDLMSSMPGKKQDFEQAIAQRKGQIEQFTKRENFFSGHEEELLKAQAELVIIKKKRSFLEALKSLINQDMESLEQQSMLQRFTLSGHLQVDGTQPILVDYAPSLAYQVTGKIFLGGGVSGRLKIGEGPSDNTDFQTIRVFSEYKILQNTFLRVEWERGGLKNEDPVQMDTDRIWSNRWFIGLGKDFNVGGNVRGNILLLYNLDSDKDLPNGQRLQVRYGFKF